MGKNIIFCFTGTGNSLKVSKDIAASVEDCSIYPMTKAGFKFSDEEYDRIGFIFPVYFIGLPLQVAEFIQSLDIRNIKNTYFFSIATCGQFCGDALKQVNRILKEKGACLNYGKKLVMASNYVVLYDMEKNTEKKDKNYASIMPQIISSIVDRKTTKIKNENPIVKFYYNKMIGKVCEKDREYNVSENCIGCGICKNICPSNNIMMENKRPIFKHNCQQCMACIQYCPKRAINYKNITQKRGRYQNPNISPKELMEFYKKS